MHFKKISTVQSLHKIGFFGGPGGNWLEVCNSCIVEGGVLLLLWDCGCLCAFYSEVSHLEHKVLSSLPQAEREFFVPSLFRTGILHLKYSDEVRGGT